MNKVFKVIWNHSLQCFVVTSELARNLGKVKSAAINPEISEADMNKSAGLSRSLLALLISSVLGMHATAANAIEITVNTTNPEDTNIGTIVTDISNLVGSFNAIKPGKPGFETITLGQARDRGIILTPEQASYVDLNIFKIGDQTTAISYTDSTTQNTVTLNTFDNDKMSTYAAKDFNITPSVAVGANGQYIDKRFFQVKDGGELTVQAGQSVSDWTNDSANQFSAYMKGTQKGVTTSSAFLVNAGSTLNYDTKTVVRAGDSRSNIKDESQYAAAFTSLTFVGKFNSVLGERTVNTLDEFKQYNSDLIQGITKGTLKLNDAQYAAELTKAWDNSIRAIYLNSGISADDAVRAIIDSDRVAYIHGNGALAAVNISKNSNIEMVASDISLVRLENGASLVNEGVFGSVGSKIMGSILVKASDSGTTVVNNGVLDAGTNPDMLDYKNPEGDKYTVANMGGEFLQAMRILNGASAINNGVINVASHAVNKSNVAVFLSNNASFSNTGAINIASTPDVTGSQPGVTDFGITIANSSTATNSGEIYIGRNRAGSDISSTQPSVGVSISSGNYSSLAGSKLTQGKLTRNSTGILASTAAAHVNNGGSINIEGLTSSSPVNIGILSQSGAIDVKNSGSINLNGVNAYGIKVLAASTAENTGTININGGLDPNTKEANYGMYVDGTGAKGKQSGTVNLVGQGTIGVHARNTGAIEIADNASLTFAGGNNQIGYFVTGKGTTIAGSAKGETDVATKGSTLFRVEDGATFTRVTSDRAKAIASGENSSIMQVTGKGSDVHATGVDVTISGKNATGIKVEGGAEGTLEADVKIKLDNEGATAGVVDGRYYDLTGVQIDNKKGDSVLTSFAELKSDTGNVAKGAYGYKVLNGGKLIHEGDLEFKSDESTGVFVSGGTLENRRNITVNGTGVHVTGAASTVTNTATATVNATNGKAAYVVDGGASLALTGAGTTTASGTAHGILLDDGAVGLTVADATINMSATGTGSAIENKAGVKDIALTNTTISVDQGIGVHTAVSMAAKNSGTIAVNGGGTGIQFEKIGGGTTDQALDMSQSQGLVINVTSANGKGLVTDTSKDLKTGVSVNVKNAAGGSALIVKGTTAAVDQSGILTSTSTTSSVVDIDNGSVATFNNSGTIQAANAAQKSVETLTGAGVNFTNKKDGVIVGHVNLMSGNNIVNLDAGSKGTDFTTDEGDDVFNLNHLKSAVAGVFDTLTAGAGTDTLNVIDTNYILSNANVFNGFESINLKEKAQLVLSGTLLPLGDSKNDAAGTGFNIDGDSTLEINNVNDVAFASHLAGTGLVKVGLMDDKSFNFTANNAADKFAGTVALTHAKMELADLNTQALSDATLRLDGFSNVHVGTGEQTIAGLKINGGTLIFDSGTPGETEAKGSVHTTKSMDLSGTGTVQVSKGSVSNDHPLAPTLLDILAQDDANTMLQLAKSDTATIGSGGALVLNDQDGNLISSTTTANIAQGGKDVAKGTYDYRLTGGDKSDGLYINYGLTQVELQTAGADALALNATGLSGAAADLSAKITGLGDLAIDTGLGNTVSLSNTLNDYTGNTDIRSGNLLMVADNVLGKTDVLSLAADTALDMNGKAQTVGSLKSATGSTVDLNGGALSLSQGGLSDGSLTGSGALNVLADTLTVNGANSGLSATTTVANGATVALNDAAGLGIGDIVNAGQVIFTNAVGTVANSIRDGVEATTRALSPTAGSVDLVSSQLTLDGDNSGFSGVFNIDADSELTATAASQLGTADIADEGKLVLNAADDWALANNVSGAGSLTKQGAGVVTLSGNAAYTGLTDIQAGGLMLGSELAPVTLASTQVNVAKNAFLAGYGGIAGNVDNQGTLFVGAQNETGTAQTFTVGKDLVNSGTVNIGHGSVAGNVLNVNGNYTGNNGQLNFNTVLGDDNSITDKLIVSGNTSGTTNVQVSNAGGTGAYTLNGIELINVGGASDGEFKQAGRIVAGAYDYSLVRGQGEKTNNWYLTNTVPTPVDPGTPVDPNKPTKPVDPDKPGEAVTRPEAAAYAANQAAANTLFNMTLHDRLGETHYVDAFTGQEQVTSLWLRQVGGHNRSHDSSGQNKTQANRYVAQLGGDIAQWSSDGEDRFHIGVMGGYANQSSHTRNHINGYKADGSVEGYSAGLYGTWFQDNEAKTGTYVDTWALYNWFDNEVSGQDIASESYKSKGVTASVETGYTWKLGEKNERESYYIQPQAQVTWMGVTSDYHQEFNGTNVRSEGDKNIQTRLGVRAFIKGHSEMDEGKERTFEPFVEANWIHNTEEFGSRLDGVSVYQDGSRDIGELKVGVEAKLNKSTNLWGNVAQQVGGKGYSDTQAMMGVKMNF